jgi:hypothetical protein
MLEFNSFISLSNFKLRFQFKKEKFEVRDIILMTNN